jgi:hypothetical protein
MVEASDVLPGHRVVARFAAEQPAVRPNLRQAFLELAIVGIGMTPCARKVFKPERQNFVCSSAQPGFVTVRADDRGMSAGKSEAGFLVIRYRVCRYMKVLYGMAILAAIMVRRGSELLVMCVLMAIRASRKLHVIDGVFACWYVTLATGNGYMFSFQRIARSRVLFHSKQRGFPAVNGMAFCTFPLCRPILKLPFVGIGRVTIHATSEGHRLAEIGPVVAIITAYFGVHSQKRIIRLRMIELLPRHIGFLPAVRGVAGFAGGLERALMRVGMAVEANAKLDPSVFYRLIRA